jgi:hypothetical protein
MSRDFLRDTVIVLMSIGLCSCDHQAHSLNREMIKREFEHDAGFMFPASATEAQGVGSPSDFHGDYSVALSFVVPAQELEAFTKLPAAAWRLTETFRPLDTRRDMLSGDQTLGSDPQYVAPVGALFIEQSGPNDVLRELAVDRAARRIYYYRATW